MHLGIHLTQIFVVYAGILLAANPASANSTQKSCMLNPADCICNQTSKQDNAICSAMLGYFCPESNMEYLAFKCIDLFGDSTICNCASQQDIQTMARQQQAIKKPKKSNRKRTKKPNK